MPPGPVSAPPRFPWGLSGHLPAGKALFCSITANAVVCHFRLHFLIIFSNGICYRINKKRTWGGGISFLQAEALGFLILAVRHPWGTVLFFFIALWINKFCSYFKCFTFEKKMAKAGVKFFLAEHVVWITSLLMFSGVNLVMHGCFIFQCSTVGKKEFVRGGEGIFLVSYPC